MIPKYFFLAETLGYLGIALFVINLLLLTPCYLRLIKRQQKVMSKIGLIINIILIIIQVTSVIMFLIVLIDPYSISGQGKVDEGTAVYFIVFAISVLVLGLATAVIDIFCQCYFGCYVDENKICISYGKYSFSDFEKKKNFILVGNKIKGKIIIKNSLVGKFLFYQIK